MSRKGENYERVAYSLLLVTPEVLEKYVNRRYPSCIMNFKEPFKEKLPPDRWNQVEELIGRYGLRRFYNHINNLVLYRTVLDHLISKGVMSFDDADEVRGEMTQYKKNKTFLDILITKPGDKYNDFIEALMKSEENRQFVGQLANTGEPHNADRRTEMKIKVRKKYKKLVKEINSKAMNAILDILYADEILNADEKEEIVKCKMTSEKNRSVLDIVIRKSECEAFLNALRCDNIYEELVDKIIAIQVTQEEIKRSIQEGQPQGSSIDVSTMVSIVSVLFKTEIPHAKPLSGDISFGADFYRLESYIRYITNKDYIDDEKMTEVFPEITEILRRLDGPEIINVLEGNFENRKKELTNTLKKMQEMLDKEISGLLTKDLSDLNVIEGCDAKFEICIKENIECTEWLKDESALTNSDRFEIYNFGTMHSLTIYNTNPCDKGVYTVKLLNAERRARLEVIEYFTKSPKNNTECVEGENVDFSCEVLEEKAVVVWKKYGYELKDFKKYEKSDHGKIHKLSILKTELDDTGNYSVQVNDRVRITSLTIKEYFSKNLENKECLEGDDVCLECEILEENIIARWFKADIEVSTSKKYKVQTHCRCHQLHICNTSLKDEGEYCVIINNCQRKCLLTVREKPKNTLSERDKGLYLDTIKSKKETRFYIRIIIIGENGVGKTCLLRRLLKVGIEDVKSTDGIDINRCKIRMHDGTWIYDKVTDKRKELIARLKRSINEETSKHDYSVIEKVKEKKSVRESFENNHNKKPSIHKLDYSEMDKDNRNDAGQEPSYNNSGKKPQIVQQKGEQQFSEEMSSNLYKPYPVLHESTQPNTTVDLQMHRDTIDNILSEDIVHKLSLFLDDIENSEFSDEILVDCGFWDFAGQREYYPTHPIFLNPHALHLLVANITKKIEPIKADKGFDQIGEYLDFWFNSVHSLRDEYEEENTQNKFNPPVILVCTNIDKLKDSEDVNKLDKRTDDFCRELNEMLSDNKRKHIRQIFRVSNTESTEEVFDDLRKLIFKFGKEMKTFGEQIPLKYIRLERALDIVRETGANILSWLDVRTLAYRCSFHNEEEIKLFLKYQHTIGNIIYFEKLNESIILNHKWLADAFRCLISVRFDEAVKLTPAWKILEETGQLADNLIVELFKKEPKLHFNKYRNHILNVMEIFGIIFRLTVLTPGGVRQTPTYYMPSMITYKSTIEDIKIEFCASEDGCLQSPWLCVKFEFMPLDVFNNIICEFISRYYVCQVPGTERIALYHGLGVFNLNDTESQKLVIYFFKDTIALQIWQWEPIEKSRYPEIFELLRLWISGYQTKYERRKLTYTVMTKCSDGDIHSPDGKRSFIELLSKENYLCKHDKKFQFHSSAEFLETWFYNYAETACFLHLEMELASLVAKGVKIIKYDDLCEINKALPISPLTQQKLDKFLSVQHGNGKLLYFPILELHEKIIIAPTHIIDTCRSIVRERQFCTIDGRLESWDKMAIDGILKKSTLDQIWQQPEYSDFWCDREYLTSLMTHLDILSEHRRYDKNGHLVASDFFIVPSMVRKKNETSYFEVSDFNKRSICLSFTFFGKIATTDLFYRFIAYCLCLWPIKKYGDDVIEDGMLFEHEAVLVIDNSLDLAIHCGEDRILVRLVHKESNSLIMDDVATAIRECLETTLNNITRLYQQFFANSRETRENIFQSTFEIKPCCASAHSPCTLDDMTQLETADNWQCPGHGIIHSPRSLLAWFVPKGKTACSGNTCAISDDNFLSQRPSDLHLRRLSLQLNETETQEMLIRLHRYCVEWDDIRSNHKDIRNVKFVCLLRLRDESETFTFKELKICLENTNLNPHKLCKVLRERYIDFADPELDKVPSDEDVDKLAPLIGSQSIHFLVELGLSFQTWEEIEYQCGNDLVKINRCIINTWKEMCELETGVKPSLRIICKAFVNIGKSKKMVEQQLQKRSIQGK